MGFIIYLAVGLVIALLSLPFLTTFNRLQAIRRDDDFSYWKVAKDAASLWVLWPVWGWFWGMSWIDTHWAQKRRTAQHMKRAAVLASLTPGEMEAYNQKMERRIRRLRAIEWFMTKVYMPLYVVFNIFTIVVGILMLTTGQDPTTGKAASTEDGVMIIILGVIPLAALTLIWWVEKRANEDLANLLTNKNKPKE